MSDPLDKLSWDDLRIIKAIGESGGLAAAARMLGFNNTTISRRLSRLERVVGAVLFDRPRTGYRPTVSGAQLIALAPRVEVDIVGVAKPLSCHSQPPPRHLPLPTSDTLPLAFLPPLPA